MHFSGWKNEKKFDQSTTKNIRCHKIFEAVELTIRVKILIKVLSKIPWGNHTMKQFFESTNSISQIPRHMSSMMILTNFVDLFHQGDHQSSLNIEMKRLPIDKTRYKSGRLKV